MDLEIAALAARQHGLVTWSQLIGAGLSPNAVGRRVRSGRLVRLHRTVYALAGSPATFERVALAAQFAIGEGGGLSHSTAGRLWSLDGFVSDEPHVLIPHQRRIDVPGITVHRAHLARGDIVSRGVFRLTSGTRTLIDLASCLTADALEEVLDDALRRGLVSIPGLGKRLDLCGRVPGGTTLRKLVEARTGRRPSGSTLQTLFRRALRGLPAPVEEYEVHGADGRFIARVDMAYPEQRVAIEVDGWKYHSGRKRWELDSARQNRLVLEGWTPLRFSSSALQDGSFRRTVEEKLRGVPVPENGSGTPRKS